MGYLRIKTDECSYKEKDIRFKEQFINGINDDRITEMIRELTAIKKTNEITNEEVLSLARRVEVQWVQKLILDMT